MPDEESTSASAAPAGATSTPPRPCGFPGCPRAAAAPSFSSGRPPAYCENPDHTAVTAFRERQRRKAAAAGTPPVDDPRPIETAAQRAAALRGQVAEVGEHLVVQLRALLEELATLSDPGAAALQIESVTSEAGEQVAAALARATRAERATRAAEVDREQADTAAEEALIRLEEVNADFERAQQSWRAEVEDLTAAQQTLVSDHQTAMAEAAAAAVAAAEEHRQALDTAAQERSELTAAHDRAMKQAQEAAAAHEDVLTRRAEDQVRSAEQARQAADTARQAAEGEARAAQSAAERAAAETATARAQLAQLAELERQLRDEAAQLRTDLAVTRTEREAAQNDVARERATADQRVRDVRDLLAAELTRLHEEVDSLRPGVQEPETSAEDGASDPVVPARRRGRKTDPAPGDTTGK